MSGHLLIKYTCRGNVKLLKKLDMRFSETGYSKRWGLFHCPFCKQEVERVLADGIKNKSCGCARHSITGATNKIHGQTPESLYRRWVTMKNKCYNPNNKWYKDYGGKGIRVCDEWCESFEPFRDWALANGYRESLDLSRKDINSDFTPENCCFTKPIVTIEKRSTSKLNRQKAQEIRRLYDEGALSQEQLAQKYGVTPSTISRVICGKAWKAS